MSKDFEAKISNYESRALVNYYIKISTDKANPVLLAEDIEMFSQYIEEKYNKKKRILNSLF